MPASATAGDIGTHIENTVHYVTGLNIRRLLATTNTFGMELDLNANIIVEYDNGTNGAYWCSQVAAGKLNGLVVRVYGSEGSLEWEQHFPDYLRFTPKGKAPEMLSRGTGYLTQRRRGTAGCPPGIRKACTGFANVYRQHQRAGEKVPQSSPRPT